MELSKPAFLLCLRFLICFFQMPVAEETVRHLLSARAKGDRHPLNGVIFGTLSKKVKQTCRF